MKSRDFKIFGNRKSYRDGRNHAPWGLGRATGLTSIQVTEGRMPEAGVLLYRVYHHTNCEALGTPVLHSWDRQGTCGERHASLLRRRDELQHGPGAGRFGPRWGLSGLQKVASSPHPPVAFPVPIPRALTSSFP